MRDEKPDRCGQVAKAPDCKSGTFETSQVRLLPCLPVTPRKITKDNDTMNANETQSERNDKIALLYLKEHNITDINQVTPTNRRVLYSILENAR